MPEIDFNGLDTAVHGPTRLGVLTVLQTDGATDFTTLKERLKLSDGALPRPQLAEIEAFPCRQLSPFSGTSPLGAPTDRVRRIPGGIQPLLPEFRCGGPHPRPALAHHLLMGEPKRNKDYQKAHFAKRTTDDTESQASWAPAPRFLSHPQPTGRPAAHLSAHLGKERFPVLPRRLRRPRQCSRSLGRGAPPGPLRSRPPSCRDLPAAPEQRGGTR